MEDKYLPINFRLLPAYRKHRRTKVTLTDTVVCNERVDIAVSQEDGQLLTAEVEIACPEDTWTSSSSSSSTLKSLTKPPVSPSSRTLNRKRKCLKLFRRVASFLLSTVGLTMLTIMYAIAGGYLFSALESHNEVTVKTGVSRSLQWHVDALWNATSELNILHPVCTRTSASFCFGLCVCLTALNCFIKSSSLRCWLCSVQ